MDGTTVYRLSFSLSLLEYIQRTYSPHLELKRLKMTMGRELQPGEESKTGIYALISRQKKTPLRVSLIKEYAEEMCDYDTRYLVECSLEVK